MKVLHLTSELAPIAKVGGLADAVAGMVKYSRSSGIDARVALPEYGFLKKVQSSKFKVQNYKSKGKINGVPVYLLENERYFGRCKGVYGCFKDEREVLRFAWFCQKVVEMALGDGFGKEGWKPDVLHCHDWPAALVPKVLARKFQIPNPKHQINPKSQAPNSKFKTNIKTLLTIHNFAYQGKASAAAAEKMIGPIGRRGQKINFLAEGIKYADFINTVSPTHAKEILRGEMGDGLVRLLREKKRKFVGILNGIEYEKKDNFYKNYNDYKNYKEKQKRRLQKETGLKVDVGAPLFALVARLAKQKGIELLINAEKREISRERILRLAQDKRQTTRNGSVAEEIIREGGQMVILGEGDKNIKDQLANIKNKLASGYPGQFVFINRFDNRLADLIFKGADFLLVPSKFEPCGLTQMMAMGFGTLPIVHNVGGLKDTVKDGLSGFVFEKYSTAVLRRAVRRGMKVYQGNRGSRGEGGEMMEMRMAAMREDFSWKRAIREYKKIYERVIK